MLQKNQMKILLEKIIILKLQLKEINFLLVIRISLLKNTFEKGYTSNWSEQTYIIDNIKFSNVHYYYLKDLNGNKIDGMFYEQKLLKTNIKDNDLYIIEKIIKKTGDKYLVKWRGYDDSFNSYVNKNDIVKNVYICHQKLHFMS